MVADKNFVWKGTLGEANTIRRALEGMKKVIGEKPVDQMSTEEKEDFGRIDKLLRIDF